MQTSSWRSRCCLRIRGQCSRTGLPVPNPTPRDSNQMPNTSTASADATTTSNQTEYARPHRRYNPLNNTWVLCSPHRARRPWLGQVESVEKDTKPEWDPRCYLCPRNERVNGEKNPDYTSTYVFTNDFAAVYEQQTSNSDTHAQKSTSMISKEEDLFKAESVGGICKVVCFSPKHNVTLPQLTVEEIHVVIQTWTKEYLNLFQNDAINYVQIFENKGPAMGCSNPHPHGQIWATSSIPTEPHVELSSMRDYQLGKHTCLLCDYAQSELTKQSRVVCTNEYWICVVPFWAVWPFETLVISQKHRRHLGEVSGEEQLGLAQILKELTTRYDKLFDCSFPYSMGIHQSPSEYVRGYQRDITPQEDVTTRDPSHIHFHFYPPLLRSATVRKFLVGFEMLGEAQRDLTPEEAAKRLRAVPATV